MRPTARSVAHLRSILLRLPAEQVAFTAAEVEAEVRQDWQLGALDALQQALAERKPQGTGWTAARDLPRLGRARRRRGPDRP